MLTIFPDLLNWSLAAPLLIRLALSGISFFWLNIALRGSGELLARFSQISAKNPKLLIKIFSILYFLAGTSLLLGLYTQIGALLFLALSTTMLLFERKFQTLTPRDISYYILLLICSISLLVMGAGLFALDLPL